MARTNKNEARNWQYRHATRIVFDRAHYQTNNQFWRAASIVAVIFVRVSNSPTSGLGLNVR